MTVGERIKEKRLEMNLSQDELAKKVGYKSRSSIQKIECARDLPLKKVSKMALALNCSPAYLMGWEDSEGNKKEPYKALSEVYEYQNLLNSLSPEEREKVSEIERKLVKITPENRTLILNLLKSLQPDV